MKRIFVLFAGLFFGLLNTGFAAQTHRSHFRSSEELVPFRFVNNTTLPASEIYVTIFGFNEHPFLVTPESPRRQGFIQFTNPKSGVGSFVNADQSIVSTTYSYPLSSFPHVKGTPGYYQVSLPYLDSGQIFFSIHQPLQLFIGMPASPAPQYATIANPIPANPDDPSYSIVYDKMEFSFEPPNVGSPPLNQLTINVTSVDFLSIPMYMTLHGANPDHTGTLSSRKTLMTNLQNAFSSAPDKTKALWNSLILKGSDGSSIVRILSPGNGLGYSYPKGATIYPLYFDADYLHDWMNGIWNGENAYYQDPSHVLKVETVVSQTPYYGLVNKNTGDFEFWKSPARSGTPDVIIPSPSSEGNTGTEIVFEAIAPWPGSTPDTKDAYDIGRLIQAGIMTGYLPCADTSVLSTESLIAAGQAVPSPLYTVNPHLPSSLQTTGPWYDLYSAALFPSCNGAYTWPWDDLVYTSAGPSIATWQPTTYVEIQLGSCDDLQKLRKHPKPHPKKK